MNITLTDGRVLKNRHPSSFCTGYIANSIEMQAGDFNELRILSYEDPIRFNAVMRQLENRFPENRVGAKEHAKG